MLPVGTITFLFTDIEGSTNLLERLKQGYVTLLANHHDIFRASFARWNGHEIDTQGDSFFAAFTRAEDAISCVIEIQRAFAAAEWPENVTVRVRMGLHTGEPIIGRTGYVGIDVVRAARIMASGYGGQVLLSQTTRGLVYQDLPQGVGIRDLGAHKLKDIRLPQEIFQLEIEGLPCDFPPLKTLATVEAQPKPGTAPFMGMQYFTEEDAPFFFGREEVTQRLLDAVTSERFLAVIGSSGSGKSSVVRAGLLPALKKNQPECWQIILLTPTAHPLEALALALTQEVESMRTTTMLMDDMRQEPRALQTFARKRIPPSAKESHRMLLVIDQFEELFTLCRDAAERQAFVDNLLAAAGASHGPVHVLINLRADFYEHLAEYSQLRELVAKHQEYLGAMSADELRRAIEEPARLGGWEFSPGLVELMLHEVGAEGDHQPEPGALPLLSHALLETWKHRRGNLMSLKAYGESGGVRKAIAHTAENLYSQELTPAQQQIARNIFLRLTELGEGTQDTRRRATLRELLPPVPYGDPKDIEEVLGKLADARLITTGEGTVEVAHEALIREWPTLREWLMQDREGLRLQRHLAETAQEWQLLAWDPGVLYRGARLAQALEWAKANPNQLNEQEQAFLDASQALADQEKAEKEAVRQRALEAAQQLADEKSHSASRLRKRAVFLSLALAAAVVLLVAAIMFARLSYERAQLAFSRELVAAAVQNARTDSQRSLLLAMQALKVNTSYQAQNALHQAISEARLRDSISFTNKKEALFGVKISSDGRQMATISQDGNIYSFFMDPARKKIDRNTLQVIPNPIDYQGRDLTTGNTLDFSPDDRFLVGVAGANTARIWDASTGDLLQTLSGHTSPVLCVSFSPDGRLVATGSLDTSVKIWETDTGNEIQTLSGFDSEVLAITFTRDGKQLIAGSYKGLVIAWDIPASIDPSHPFQKAYDFLVDAHSVGNLAVNRDATRLAVAGKTRLMIYDLSLVSTGSAPVLTLNVFAHENSINGMSFNSSEDRIYTASADGIVKEWDSYTGKELLYLSGNAGGVGSIALNPQGNHLLAATYGGYLNLWQIDVNGNEEWFALQGSNQSFGKLSDDGKAFGNIIEITPLGARWGFWELTPDGLKDAPDREIWLPNFRVESWYMTGTLDRVVWLRDDVDGRAINAEVWDTITGRQVTSFPVYQSNQEDGPLCEQYVDCIYLSGYSRDGTQITVTSQAGTVTQWDLQTGQKVHDYPGSGYQDFSPDGKLLSIPDAVDSIIRIWDTDSGKPERSFEGHTQPITFGHFSPDGRRLVTSGMDSTARLWDVQTGEELRTFTNPATGIFWLIFSQDGNYLATAGYDETVRVWDVISGEELLSFTGTCAWITPDNKKIVINDGDGVVRGYYLDANLLMEKARSRLMRAWTPEECAKFLHTSTCPANP